MESDSNRLKVKYDQIYHDETIVDRKVSPIEINDPPINRYQAIAYLARPGGRLLDVGCGSGALLATFASEFDELVGIELSSVRAEQARRGLAHLPHCQIFNEPLEKLPTIFDTPFDCIVWADVLEHIPDVIEAMHILADLSRVGTQLVTTTPNIAFLSHRLRLLAGRGLHTSFLPQYSNEGFDVNPLETVLYDNGHFHYFSFRQVEILYQIAGFQPERRLGFGKRLSRLRNLWPTLLSAAVCISGVYQGNQT